MYGDADEAWKHSELQNDSFKSKSLFWIRSSSSTSTSSVVSSVSFWVFSFRTLLCSCDLTKEMRKKRASALFPNGMIKTRNEISKRCISRKNTGRRAFVVLPCPRKEKSQGFPNPWKEPLGIIKRNTSAMLSRTVSQKQM